MVEGEYPFRTYSTDSFLLRLPILNDLPGPSEDRQEQDLFTSAVSSVRYSTSSSPVLNGPAMDLQLLCSISMAVCSIQTLALIPSISFPIRRVAKSLPRSLSFSAYAGHVFHLSSIISSFQYYRRRIDAENMGLPRAGRVSS